MAPVLIVVAAIAVVLVSRISNTSPTPVDPAKPKVKKSAKSKTVAVTNKTTQPAPMPTPAKTTTTVNPEASLPGETAITHVPLKPIPIMCRPLSCGSVTPKQIVLQNKCDANFAKMFQPHTTSCAFGNIDALAEASDTTPPPCSGWSAGGTESQFQPAVNECFGGEYEIMKGGAQA